MIKNNEKQLFFILLGIILIGSLWFRGDFLSTTTSSVVMHQLPEYGLVSLTLMVVMIASGINLSVVSMTTLSGILGAILMKELSFMGGFSVVIGVLIMLIIGVATGFINGFIVSYLEVPPIIATIGTMLFFQGLAMNITKGGSIASFSETFVFLGNGTLFGIPLPFIFFLIVVIGLHYILYKLEFGQQLYRIGKSKEAALYSGIPIKKHVLKIYIISGIIAGVAAIIMTARYNSIRVDYGSTYLITGIVVVTLGGVDVNGGKGNVFGVVLALFIVSIIKRILSLAYIDSNIIDFIMVGILFVNLILKYLFNKIKTVDKSSAV
ncbi:MAG: ABC transporter permease [Eubacteriales bacterium]